MTSRYFWIFVLAVLGLVPALYFSAAKSDHHLNSEAVTVAFRPLNAAETEWRHYLGDAEHSHASTLDQITLKNVAKLRQAWRFDAGGEAADGSSQMQCSPLVVKGLLYCTSPALAVFALNAATGELLWKFDSDFGGNRNVPNVNRGVSYWAPKQAKPDSGRILFTAGSRLYSLEALTGEPDPQFGDGGSVDLRAGLPDWAKSGAVVATSPGTVFGNLLILGSRVSEFSGAAPGHVRAFDIETGELAWLFRTIPEPGSFGSDSWPADTIDRAGGANSWPGIAVDHERSIAFVPTGSPSFDFFGGDREGDNLFANSLVALNAATGERIWHYQFVRHDLWDRDLPAPPNLIELERNGAAIPAVAQATKTGHFFVFHRETGEPLFPIAEIDVEGEGVPGEKLTSLQPIPVSPPPFSSQHFEPTDRNPAMTAAVQQRMQSLHEHALYRPPSLKGTIHYPGIDGGAEWGGAAWDNERQTLYINSNEVPYLLQVTEVEPGDEKSPKMAYLMVCAGCHGVDRRGDGVSVPSLVDIDEKLSWPEIWRIVRDGRGRMPAFGEFRWYERAAMLYYLHSAEDKAEQLTEHQQDSSLASGGGMYLNAGYQKLVDPENLPASKPPWGSLTAINLREQKIDWRIPFGDYPQLLDRGISGLGSENYGGPIITASGLMFIAATPDRLMKAYDTKTGNLLWRSKLPFAGFATPVTYAIDGKQYVVIAAGGGKLGQPSGSALIAFALPDD